MSATPPAQPGAPARPEPGGSISVAARRRARVAVGVVFAAHGLLIGSWAPRIPALKDHLGLGAGALGLALLAPALGTVLAARTIGKQTARHGSAAVTRVGIVAYCLLACLPGFAVNLPTLWLALLVWGIAMGTMDVAMNAQGVAIETYRGRPLMSGLHAVWSVGGLVGSLLGAAGASAGVSVGVQQLVIGVVLAVAAMATSRALLPDPPSRHSERSAPTARRWRPRRPALPILLLGLAAIFALMAEGAVSDWSAVLLREHLDVPGGRAGFAYAAFCVTMTVGRLAGDRMVHRFGRARSVGAVSVVGAVGLGAGLTANSFGGAVTGFALLGIGLSLMVPVIYSAAADTPGPSGPAIAAVAALGCVGLLAGPSLIGLVAQLTSIEGAMFLLPPFTLVAGLLGVIGMRAVGARRAHPPVPAPPTV